jgi:hypothetical protein
VQPRKLLDVERAALHLAEVAHVVDPKARFAPASQADLNSVAAEIPLSPELITWYACAAPMSDVYIPQVGNDLRISGISELVQAQQGYRWVQWPITAERKPGNDWPENWVVVADEGADPVLADTAIEGTPVLRDMHGMGRWAPWLLAPSLVAYLEAQARWIEICLIESGTLSSSWQSSPWDEDGQLTAEIERPLRASLSAILPENCIRRWL